MKLSNMDKKVFGLGLLIALLIMMVGFSVERVLAPSVDPRASAGSIAAVHPSQASQRYAGMIPYELTPPGEVTPIDTPAPTVTPIATSSHNDE